jgi:uncharacterized membrane protein
VTFSHNVDDIVQVVEGVGVGTLIVGGLAVFAQSGARYLSPSRRATSYQFFRKHLGRVILLGLEILIVADIIGTVIVDQTFESVAVLATIVVVRIMLSWSLSVEIDGVWPWKQNQVTPTASDQADSQTAPPTTH